jgi:D,D-heptose 1,7-bisphosphate phosphatase
LNVAQVVFLVGGVGSRLGSLTAKTAKPLLPVGERPFLDYLLDEASRYGFERALLLCGHGADDVVAKYAGRTVRGMRIEAAVEPAPAGTAGALRLAADRLDECFFLANGDSLFDCNWLSLRPGPHDAAPWTVRMMLARGIAGERYGRIQADRGLVTSFTDRGDLPDRPINAGIYLVCKSILDAIGSLPCSIENDVLPVLAARSLVHGVIATGAFIDIGIPSDFERAQRAVPEIVRRPAVILDRDGVLNADLGYVHRIDQFQWIDGARDAVRWLNDEGIYVFVATNQAGVARGYYDEPAVHALHGWMQRELQRAGAHVDAIEYCPFHVDGVVEKYRLASPMRKPGPGMIQKLLGEWSVEHSRSLLIGDKESDVAAAAAAGIPGHLFGGGNLLDFVRRLVPGRGKTSVGG